MKVIINHEVVEHDEAPFRRTLFIPLLTLAFAAVAGWLVTMFVWKPSGPMLIFSTAALLVGMWVVMWRTWRLYQDMHYRDLLWIIAGSVLIVSPAGISLLCRLL